MYGGWLISIMLCGISRKGPTLIFSIYKGRAVRFPFSSSSPILWATRTPKSKRGKRLLITCSKVCQWLIWRLRPEGLKNSESCCKKRNTKNLWTKQSWFKNMPIRRRQNVAENLINCMRMMRSLFSGMTSWYQNIRREKSPNQSITIRQWTMTTGRRSK